MVVTCTFCFGGHIATPSSISETQPITAATPVPSYRGELPVKLLADRDLKPGGATECAPEHRHFGQWGCHFTGTLVPQSPQSSLPPGQHPCGTTLAPQPPASYTPSARFPGEGQTPTGDQRRANGGEGTARAWRSASWLQKSDAATPLHSRPPRRRSKMAGGGVLRQHCVHATTKTPSTPPSHIPPPLFSRSVSRQTAERTPPPLPMGRGGAGTPQLPPPRPRGRPGCECSSGWQRSSASGSASRLVWPSRWESRCVSRWPRWCRRA